MPPSRFLAGPRPRAAAALLLVAGAFFLQPVALTPVFHRLAQLLALPHPPAPTVLYLSRYTLLISLRLAWWILVALLVSRLSPSTLTGILRLSRTSATRLLGGFAIGALVMVLICAAILAVRSGSLALAPGSLPSHLAHAAGWLGAQLLLASEEELFLRGLVLLLVARLVGPRTAVVASALVFALMHGANPGVSLIWLLRITTAGLLLGYSVLRTRALWWAIGYHAGWNWACAPLLGAADSGYSNFGHIASFTPTGSPWITGGPVGVEGSLFAFVAVLLATALLLATTPART